MSFFWLVNFLFEFYYCYCQNLVETRGERIIELEDTLKESLKITAEREMLISDQQTLLSKAQTQVSEESNHYIIVRYSC